MIDCAEGTQIQLRRSRLKMQNIHNIFLTHLHGDHCFGLMGLLSTLALLGNTATMHVWGPTGLKEIFQPQIDFFCSGIDYTIELHEVSHRQSAIIYEDRSVSVSTLPLRHRVPCTGYLFQEKSLLPHIRREAIEAFDIPVSQINNIKTGMDWTTPDGEVIPNHLLTTPADPVRSYAYMSDTMFAPELAEKLQGINLLYHEATFTKEQELLARQNFHSTAEQAATMAQKANVQQLLIGHFSSRYKDESILLREAQTIFPNTVAAYEGMTIKL